MTATQPTLVCTPAFPQRSTAGLCLVTGANGHLGNTLVRALLARGHAVRAGVRRMEDRQPLEGLPCERVRLDLLDADSLRRALMGVDVLYQVAAVFRHWARDAERDIVQPNVEGSRLVLQAAAAAGVRKVVYVSSVAAVGHTGEPFDEASWNTELENPYYRSKIESERAAWEAARRLGVAMVSVLPGAIVGPYAHSLTDTMNFLEQVRRRRLLVDPDFHFNFVDVRDVAAAMLAAAERGRPGERYILANHASSSLADMAMALGGGTVPGRVPPRPPRWLLAAMASLQQGLARVTGRPPELLRSQVRLFHGVRQVYDIGKACRELGYSPRPPADALAAGFAWLEQRAAMEPLRVRRPKHPEPS
ncbi:NAD-dependent epimerase/dehydratase family protein [Xenophilus sp.]|uniref:NAD-dependent epimerase/dehydratase family protein n=1 Tax=Xenophilus sp. TaxID=1873499 RepID=UPI0037DD3B4C